MHVLFSQLLASRLHHACVSQCLMAGVPPQRFFFFFHPPDTPPSRTLVRTYYVYHKHRMSPTFPPPRSCSDCRSTASSSWRRTTCIRCRRQRRLAPAAALLELECTGTARRQICARGPRLRRRPRWPSSCALGAGEWASSLLRTVVCRAGKGLSRCVVCGWDWEAIGVPSLCGRCCALHAPNRTLKAALTDPPTPPHTPHPTLTHPQTHIHTRTCAHMHTYAIVGHVPHAATAAWFGWRWTSLASTASSTRATRSSGSYVVCHAQSRAPALRPKTSTDRFA